MAKRTSKKDDARPLAIALARLAEDNKAEDITVLNLRDVSPVTDYFVICTGTSGRQMRSVAEAMIKHGKAAGQPPFHKAGMDGGEWIIVDFFDVVVHIFDEDHRCYYDLELIWGGAPHVRWRRPASAGPKKTTE